ncbi:MAG: hypothetical protein WKF57_06695 [Nakamurella sp.]
MAAPRRGAASRAQQSSHGTLIALAGLLGGAGIAYLHYPGVAVLWLALIVAAWVEPPAIMTGKKDSSGFPTPAHPGEEKNLRRNRFWRMLKLRLVVPNTSWLPGWPPLMVFAAAAVLATAAWCLPVSGIPYGAEINAGAAFIVTMTVTAARRANTVEGPGCPGTRITAIPKMFALRGFLTIGAGLIAAAAAAWAVMTFVPVRGEWHLTIRPLGIGAAAATVFVIVIAHPLKTAALARWRMLTEFGALWDQRWTQIKIDPPPRLLDHREVGQATIDEFAAPSSLGSQAFWSIAPKIAPAVGAGTKVCILEMPDIDRTGQPVPGSRHPINFQVVTWPATDLPDLTDPGLDTDLAELFARCAFAWTTESLGYGRPVLLSMQPLFTTDTPEQEPVTPHQEGEPVQVAPCRPPRRGVRRGRSPSVRPWSRSGRSSRISPAASDARSSSTIEPTTPCSSGRWTNRRRTTHPAACPRSSCRDSRWRTSGSASGRR